MDSLIAIGVLIFAAYYFVNRGVISLPGSIPTGTITSSTGYATSGLQVGASQSQVAGEVGAGITAAAPASGPAAPVVAAIGAAVSTLGGIFKGANPLQVPAAQIEQVYEAVADNVWALFYHAHMITRATAIAGMQAALQAAQQALSTSGLGIAAQKGLANATAVIGQMIDAAPNTPDQPATAELSVSQAQQFYVGGPGWYASSISKATAITNAFIQSLGAVA